jgi:hypothetical protein
MTPARRARLRRRATPTLVATLALMAGAVAPACHRDIHLLPLTDVDGAGGAGVGGAAGGGGAGIGGVAGAVSVGGAAGAGVSCAGGLGPSITLPTATGPVCAAALSARGHRFGLCTCEALMLGSKLRTDAFDSTDSSFNDEVSAAVGINGALTTTAELSAGGAIYVADPGGVYAAEHLQAGASFQSNGPLTMLSSNADLLANASVNGPVSGQVQVGGTLYVPASADVGPQVQAASVVTGAVSVATPCDCTDGFVDLQSAMTTAMNFNNDAAARLDPGALVGPVMTSQILDLYCGTYYLTSVKATAPITLAVHGRALLAVPGDVSVQAGGLTVNLDPSAELDLLIGGWFTVSGGGTIGAPAAPARFRIWVSGMDPLAFAGQPTVAAIIHAPNASVSAADGLTISGSLLTKSLILGGDSQSFVHYDRAILKAGVPCGGAADAAVP